MKHGELPGVFWNRQLHYVLIGQTPVPEPDLLKWLEWWETAENRVVASTCTGLVNISTIFLGVDHSLSGTPVLYETMIFIGLNSAGYQVRCSTWLEAEERHRHAVELVSRLENPTPAKRKIVSREQNEHGDWRVVLECGHERLLWKYEIGDEAVHCGECLGAALEEARVRLNE